MRPTSRLRLSDLRPAEVAAEACALVIAQTGRLLLALSPAASEAGPHLPPSAEAAARSTEIGLTVADLTRFAQSGDVGDWGGPEGALDAIQSVCAVLYSRAGEPRTFGGGELDEGAPVGAELAATSIGLVLLAAYARAELARRGSQITVRQLATLLGLTPHGVRQLGRTAEIEIVSRSARDGRIARGEALRVLGARGVLGFGR